MKPSDLHFMSTNVLRDPVVIKGKLDRPNVAIKISPYRLSSAQEIKEHGGSDLRFLAQKIKDTVQNEKANIYLSYAVPCKTLSEKLTKLGLKCGTYTGTKTSNTERKEAFYLFKSNEIQVLVATKAFGMGVNLPNVRHIINVGSTENLSLWMQECGRAGRDGAEAFAHLFVCKYIDMKKLTYWTKGTILN